MDGKTPSKRSRTNHREDGNYRIDAGRDPDGIILDKECDIEKTRGLIPEAIPLFGACGSFDMLAKRCRQTLPKRSIIASIWAYDGVPGGLLTRAKIKKDRAF